MDKLLFIVPPYVDYTHFTAPAYNERTVIKESVDRLIRGMHVMILSNEKTPAAH